jgi:hypothetical protein
VGRTDRQSRPSTDSLRRNQQGWLEIVAMTGMPPYAKESDALNHYQWLGTDQEWEGTSDLEEQSDRNCWSQRVEEESVR